MVGAVPGPEVLDEGGIKMMIVVSLVKALVAFLMKPHSCWLRFLLRRQR